MLEAWVAELNSHIVGHVAISTPQDDDADPALWMQKTPGRAGGIAVLGRLFVLPSARGHMVGERLVQAAVAAAERRGLRTVLDVMAKDSAAIRLYERLGWQFIGATEHEFDGGQTTPAYCYVAPFP
jgi:GNAT superfamily N-acetyltransferase